MNDASPRQPIFNIPMVVLVLIAAMAAIHATRLWLPDETDARMLARLAFVPGRVTVAFDPAAVMRRLVETADPRSDGPLEIKAFFLGTGSPQPWTAVTYAFLHGNWTHFGLNAIWLVVFGAPVAKRWGAGRFVIFFAASAVAGAAAHYLVDPLSLQPLVGASAAVSGCMGAALRFMFGAPGTPSLQADGSLTPAHRAPRRSLRAILRDRRAGAFLVVWFLSNLVTGLAAVPLGLSDAPIAWQAHIGGFILGLLAFPLFDPSSDPLEGDRPDHEDPA